MKIKINQELMDVDGVTPIQDKIGILNLKQVCTAAILTPVENEEWTKKQEKWDMFKKFRDADITQKDAFVELTIEELKILKDSIGKWYPPLIMGQCFEMLENLQS